MKFLAFAIPVVAANAVIHTYKGMNLEATSSIFVDNLSNSALISAETLSNFSSSLSNSALFSTDILSNKVSAEFDKLDAKFDKLDAKLDKLAEKLDKMSAENKAGNKAEFDKVAEKSIFTETLSYTPSIFAESRWLSPFSPL